MQMFCPKCGKADQTAETFCRQCGTFLPDLSKPTKKKVTPSDHIKANTVLSVMSIVACFTLAILIYIMLAFRPETHPLIYVTAGVLMAMGAWHIQTLIRIRMLKKQLKKGIAPEIAASDAGLANSIPSEPTAALIEPANFEDVIPASVTEHTTKHLINRSSQSKH